MRIPPAKSKQLILSWITANCHEGDLAALTTPMQTAESRRWKNLHFLCPVLQRKRRDARTARRSRMLMCSGCFH